MPRGLHLQDVNLSSEENCTRSPEPQPMSSPSPSMARQVANIPRKKKGKFDPTIVLKVYIEDGALEPSYECSQRCTYYFWQMNDAEGVCWKKVSTRTKAFYWGEFKKYITHREFTEEEIKKAWLKKVAERYADWMSTLSKLEKKPDQGISQANWDAWKKYWKTDEFQVKSNRGKRNRDRNGKGMVNHTGGSQTFKVTLKRMHARNQFPDPFEFHRLTHTFKKRPEVFCDDKARQVHVDYTAKEKETLLQVQSQAEANGAPTPDHLPLEERTTLFKSAAGGEKRSTVYGSGSAAPILYTLERPCSSSCRDASSRARGVVELQQEVVQLKNDLAREREERDNVINEAVKKTEDRVYAMVRKMMHKYQEKIIDYDDSADDADDDDDE